MSHRLSSILGAFALAAGLSSPAFAQSTPASPAVALEGDVRVVRQVTENGRTSEKLEEPSQVVPGDKLVFTTRYVNNGAEPATDFVVTNPLPAPVRLSRADNFKVSVDGGKVFGELASLKITDATGAQRAAELGDVTHVRWTLDSIAPGASGEVTYFAEVR